MLNLFRFLLLLSVTVWVGMLIFFTFFVTPAIFKALPREVAGELVSHIFPDYWRIGYTAGIIALASLIVMSFIEKGLPAARLLLLSFMTALTFYSGMVVAPEAKALKERLQADQALTGKGQLRKEFGRVHFRSYALNMAVILSGVAFIFLTSRNTRL